MAKPPRVALWGAGVMAGAHAAACQALGWPIVGVASRRRASADTLAARVKATAMSYAELRDLPDVDVAIISTPPGDHLDAAQVWSARSVPTVVSTPLCATLADADRLVEIERSSDVPMLFASNLAAAPVVQALLRHVGQLGTINIMSGRSIRPAPTWGEFHSGAWGGGALLHPGVHQITLMLLVARLAGSGRPVRVAATLGRQRVEDTDNHAELTMTFGNGTTAHTTVSWRGAEHPTWDFQASSDTGVLRLDMDPVATLEHNGEVVPTPLPRSTPAGAERLAEIGLVAELTTFWADVVDGRRPVMNMAFGREVLDLVSASYASARLDGAPVDLPFDGPRDLTPHELWSGTTA